MKPTCILLSAFIAISPVIGAERPRLTPFRLDEDWSFLRDPSQRTEPLDWLKYIPLDDRDFTYLTLGGEYRHRFEFYNNDVWGAITPDDDDGYHLLRAMMFADLHFGPGFRWFTEISSTTENDKSSPRKPTDRNELALHQVFGQGSFHDLGPVDELMIRAGRQELVYGSGRLITFRDGPNTRLSFDAAVVRAFTEGWKVDAFYGRPVETDEGVFDDQSLDTQSIGGLYGVTQLGSTAPATLDVYLLDFRNEMARYAAGMGKEHRYSLGSRFSGKYGPFDYNFEAVGQWGDFSNQDIRAWTFASDSGVTLPQAPFAPRLFLKANIISGDKDPEDDLLGTFNAMYPRGAYFGEIGLIGPGQPDQSAPGHHLESQQAVGADIGWRILLARKHRRRRLQSGRRSPPRPRDLGCPPHRQPVRRNPELDPRSLSPCGVDLQPILRRQIPGRNGPCGGCGLRLHPDTVSFLGRRQLNSQHLLHVTQAAGWVNLRPLRSSTTGSPLTLGRVSLKLSTFTIAERLIDTRLAPLDAWRDDGDLFLEEIALPPVVVVLEALEDVVIDGSGFVQREVQRVASPASDVAKNPLVSAGLRVDEILNLSGFGRKMVDGDYNALEMVGKIVWS